MKKVLSIIAMATLAVLFCGCNKENAPATGSMSVTISASMPDDEITTKTDLNGTTLTWKSDDKIYLSGLSSAETWAGLPVTIMPGSISADGKIAVFTCALPLEWKDERTVVGYYGMRANRENEYRDGGWYPAYEREDPRGTFTDFLFYTNPCFQEYNRMGPKGDYLAMADPLVKQFQFKEDLQFSFQNLMSIFKIFVRSSTSTRRLLSAIKVVGDGDPLSGTFYGWKIPVGVAPQVNWFFDAMTDNNGSCEPIADDFSRGTYGNWVQLRHIEEEVTSKIQPFYLVVFPGRHGNLRFTLTDVDGNSKVVTWNTPFTAEAGMVYNFPEIRWD